MRCFSDVISAGGFMTNYGSLLIPQTKNINLAFLWLFPQHLNILSKQTIVRYVSENNMTDYVQNKTS